MMTTRLATFPVKHPSAALLFVQILGILLYPLWQTRRRSVRCSVLSACSCWVRTLYVVKRGPWLTGFAKYSHFPSLASSAGWRSTSIPAEWSSWPRSRGRVLFLRDGQLDCLLFEAEFATVDELFAAPATFTLPMCT